MRLQSSWCESDLVLQRRWAHVFGEGCLSAEVPELAGVEYPLG